MNKLIKFVLSLGLPFAAGFIGSLATMPNIPIWYAALEKPFFNPPNWLFGPVWTLLYILMGISLYLIWNADSRRSKRVAFRWYGVQLVLNLAWSLVFFGLQSPVAGLFIIIGLIVSIAMTMRAFWPISRLAAYLLVPYLAWVSFATLLNGAIVALN